MKHLRLAILLAVLLPTIPSAVAAQTGYECKGPEGKPTACVCHGAITSESCKALQATGSCRGTHWCCKADHKNDRHYCWCEQGGCDNKRDPIGTPPAPRTSEDPS
jgi:hypothetical protein